MKIIIDGKETEVIDSDKNIVDVADRVKAAIPAPCYRNNRAKGCCNVCVVEVNGEQKYACATKPADGMKVIVNREDLKEIRKEKTRIYNESIKATGRGPACECDCDCGDDSAPQSDCSSGGCCC